MKQRRLCRLLLPLLLWSVLAGLIGNGRREEASRPWPEGSSIEAEGTVSKQVTKDTGQRIYLSNISYLSEASQTTSTTSLSEASQTTSAASLSEASQTTSTASLSEASLATSAASLSEASLATSAASLSETSQTTSAASLSEASQTTSAISLSETTSPTTSAISSKYQKALLYLQQETEVPTGSRVRFRGICDYPEEAWNPGEFDAKSYYESQGIGLILWQGEILACDGKGDRLAILGEQIRKCLSASISGIVNEEEAGVLESLLLGDRTSLGEEIKTLYQDNGIIHVLAISGLHISMVGRSLYLALRRLRRSFAASAFWSGLLVFSYGALTGFAPSAVRAVCMFLIFLGAQILGRTYDMPIAMTVAATLMLWKNPSQITQAGFLLSFAAVAGVQAAGLWQGKFLKDRSLGVSLSSWLFTLPICAWFYYRVPVFGILLNQLVVPSMSVLMVCGGAAAIAGCVSTAAGTFLAAPVHLILQVTFWICRQCRLLPGAIQITGRPEIWQILIFYLLLLISFCIFRKKGKIDLIKRAVGIILGVGVIFWRPSVPWSMTVLNVGQGDGICIQTDARRAWMVDGGSTSRKQTGERCLLPYLEYNGIAQIDGWLISHFDEDHVNGLLELLEGYRRNLSGQNAAGVTICRILIPDGAPDCEAKTELLRLAEQAGIPVSTCRKGDRFRQGEMKLEVFGPDGETVYEDANAGSMVVKITYGDWSALLTGDVQGTGEEQLMQQDLGEIDVLKVSHHGSKNSSCEEFLEQVGGSLALISCGESNRYGHPHEETLERLQETGYRILRTDLEGGPIRITVPDP